MGYFIKKILRFKKSLKQIRLGLRAELVCFIMLLIILPLLLFSVVSYNIYKNSLLKESSEYSYKIISQTSANLDMYIEGMINLSLMPLYDKEIIEQLENNVSSYYINKQYAEMYKIDKFKNLMFMMNNLRTEIDGVFIFSIDGSVYHNIQGKGIIGTYNYNNNYDYKKSEWYMLAKEAGGKSIIIGTHKQEQVLPGDKDVFSLAKIIKSGGREIGAMLIDVNLNRIEQICEEVIYGPDEGIIVFDEKGGIILSTFSDIPKEHTLLLFEKIYEEDTGNISTNVAGKNYLVTYKRLNYTEWKVVRMVAIDRLLNPTRFIKQITTLIFVLCIGFSIVLVYILTTRITKPIYMLIKEMERVENGDLTVHVNIHSNNEIGKLGKSFNKMVDKLNNLIYRVYTAELRQKETQIAALQSQINPHFLYNTLDSIHMMAEINMDYEVSRMVTCLADILRYSISRHMDVVSIADEICHVENYIALQEVRYGDKLKFFIDIPEEIKTAAILKLTIQPIIENSIYHGMDSRKERNFIILKAEKKEGIVIITIIDNGKGMTKEQLQKVRNTIEVDTINTNAKSIGLSNVNQRLKAHFGAHFGIEIDSTLGKGTEVKITIPFIRASKAGDIKNVQNNDC